MMNYLGFFEQHIMPDLTSSCGFCFSTFPQDVRLRESMLTTSEAQQNSQILFHR